MAWQFVESAICICALAAAGAYLEVQARGGVVGVVLLQLDGRLGVDGRHAGGVLDPVQWDGAPHLHALQSYQPEAT